MKRFVFTKLRLIGFCCCVLLPIAAVSLGILMFSKDVILTVGLAFVFFLIPLIAAGLLSCCIFSNCKAWKKSVLSGVILLLFLIVFFFSLFCVGWTKVKHYEGNEAAQQYSRLENELMPDLAQLGKPTHIEHYRLFSYVLIFSYQTDSLICRYNQEDYAIQKAKLDTTYIFQTEKTADNFDPIAEIDGYQFRMLSSKEYDLLYPKKVVLVGCSDDAKEIVYLTFCDMDLDYITSLKDFILEECGWKYIR